MHNKPLKLCNLARFSQARGTLFCAFEHSEKSKKVCPEIVLEKIRATKVLQNFVGVSYKLLQIFITLVIFTVISFLNPSFADPYLEDDFGIWTPIYIQVPITKKIRGEFEVNPRIEENLTHIHQLIVRPSLGYQLTKELSVWQAYAWTLHYVPRFVREQRIWHQVLHEKEFSKLSLINRFRMEERFIQNVDGVSLRTRYLLKGIYPIGKTKLWGIVLSNELFVNLNSHSGGPQGGIDQNRLFVGLSKKISNNVRMEGGYQLQYINDPAPKIDKLNHLIMFNFYVTLPQIMRKS